jgi:carboxypeptidase D
LLGATSCGATDADAQAMLNGFSDRRPPTKEQRDVEAARDYDETELDDLSGGRKASRDEERFGLADSDDEEDGRAGRANGRMN